MAPKQIAAGQWHGGSEAHVVEDLDEVSDGSFFRLDQSLACAQSVCVCVTSRSHSRGLDLTHFVAQSQGAPEAEIGQVPTKTPIFCL